MKGAACSLSLVVHGFSMPLLDQSQMPQHTHAHTHVPCVCSWPCPSPDELQLETAHTQSNPGSLHLSFLKTVLEVRRDHRTACMQSMHVTPMVKHGRERTTMPCGVVTTGAPLPGILPLLMQYKLTPSAYVEDVAGLHLHPAVAAAAQVCTLQYLHGLPRLGRRCSGTHEHVLVWPTTALSLWALCTSHRSNLPSMQPCACSLHLPCHHLPISWVRPC